MVFVTVGTHEQQFDRLVKYMDEWADAHNEEVFIQTGYSNHEPQNCKWSKFFAYQDMSKLMANARIVITHGGPSSFIMALQNGKIPIVVPRNRDFNEHVNNHQIEFCRKVSKECENIIVVENINLLGGLIDQYDEISAGMKKGLNSNNMQFCKEFERIVARLVQ